MLNLTSNNSFQVGSVFREVKLSHVDPDGTIFVQMNTMYFEAFKSIERTVSPEKFMEMKEAGPYSLDKQSIYITPWEGAYGRAQIQSFRNDGEVEIQFIDYGNYQIVGITDLIPCDLVSKMFANFPPQVPTPYLQLLLTI